MIAAFLAMVATAGTIEDATGAEVSATPETRLVVVGGGLTESVYAIGAGAQVVGVDATSLYPDEVEELPKVGYFRQLSAEGVLSLKPELVVARADSGPPEVIEQVRRAGVAVALLPEIPSVDGAKQRIELLGALLDREAEAERLVTELDAAVAGVDRPDEAPRVLFIYARGAGSLQVAGEETAADAMIELAGGVNPIEAWTGYKPLTAEGVIAAQPDVILLTDRGLASIGGVDGVLAQPGIAATPAGRDRRVVAIDDLLLLGFGPRTGQAVTELAEAISR